MNHAEAARIIREEWPKVHGREATDKEVLFTQSVALLETGYGRVGQHGKLAAQGLYNWANIEKARTGDTCEPGWAPGVDQGKVCFRVYSSDNEAARGLIQTLTKRHWPVLQAIQNEGTPEAVAKAMKVSPAYYGAPESTYAQAIRNAIKAIGSNIPVPNIPPAPAVSGQGFLPLLVLGACGIGAYMLTRKSGRRIRLA